MDEQFAITMVKAAEVFSFLSKNQKLARFYGLRDFYSFAKRLNEPGSIRAHDVMHAIEREFGTLLKIIFIFSYNFTGGFSGDSKREILQMWEPVARISRLLQRGSLDLITENLCSKKSRHLMIISHNLSGNHILFGLSNL